MASGTKIVVPISFTDNTLPVLHDDAILTTGSLVLYDMIHSANPVAAGAVNAQAVPNIAWKECAAAIGSGTQSSLQGTMVFGNSSVLNNGTKGKIERSGKGGLHVIVSQANALAANDGASLSMSAAIQTYVTANTGHTYYFSAWDYITRANTGTFPTTAATTYDISNASTTHLLAMFRQENNFLSSPAGSRVSPGGNSVGGRYLSAANSAISPTGLQTNLGGPNWGNLSGSYNNAVLASRNNNWPSFIFYRMYIEDLTVSGRSWATVDAIDFALWTAAVGTSGGRYNGDTFTAVSTVP